MKNYHGRFIMKKHIQITSVVIGSLLVFPLMAATVSLVPSTLTVDEGGQFSVDVMMDAADVPGSHEQPTAFLGSFKVEFDSAVVQYDGFEFLAPAQSLPVFEPIGVPVGVQIGFVNALDVGVIGTFNFTTLGSAGDVISISIGHLYPFGISTFVNMLPANVGFDPDFYGTEVSIVPIPASVWLFASGLGLLGWIRRRGVAVS